MKSKYFFVSIVFTFLFFDLSGQENSKSISETTEGVCTTAFNWKPFTIELNSSNVGHGISIEKKFIKNMAFRVGVASDLKSDTDIPREYKINFGVIYDVFNHRFLSLRMGIDLGMRKISPDYLYNYSESGIIFCGLFEIPSAPISAGFIDIPFILQCSITEKISFEVGVRTMFQKPTNFGEMITFNSDISVRPAAYYTYEIDKRLHNYHVGLRYKFTE